MSDNLINIYISEELKPLLESYNINSEIINITLCDIHDRLASILSRWSNREFRRTILVTGYEEAFFYEPNADIEIRALVVVAVRNSIIEDLCSTREAAIKIGLSKPAFPDDDVRIFTRNAIDYFRQFDFSKDLCGVTIGKTDFYGKLQEKYPVAWRALTHLGNWQPKCHKYTPLKQEPMQLEFLNETSNTDKLVVEVRSGMDAEIGADLMKQLKSIGLENRVFLSDSFKAITRNVDKLFKIIEYTLRAGSMLVTSNFYITNGYVARRALVLKPGHSTKEMKENLNNFYGLRKSHREALQYALKELKN